MPKALHPDMQNEKHSGSKPGPSTARYLDIAELRDDVVIMKDGTIRAVVMTASVNFALKSPEEQDAAIQGYVSFLNALEYPIQIVIQSRRMNIDLYIQRLRDTQKLQQNELLKAQINDYIGFVSELVTLGDIMSKRFYVVVPYNPLSDTKKSFWTRLKEALSPASVIELEEKIFNERKQIIMTRVGQIQSGLGSMGLTSSILDTQGLIELYFGSYNPDAADSQKITDINQLRVEA